MREALDEALANSKHVAAELQALRQGIDKYRDEWREQITDANRDRMEAERNTAAAKKADQDAYEKEIATLDKEIKDLRKPPSSSSKSGGDGCVDSETNALVAVACTK
ncbi:hypothetical protein RhiLY_06079 [Ceratobasidium sp. AG-Ba]|nr:hypothetical protein RhiLY_06079 [Ceratobasidium sp. AG-Ba]